MLGITFTSNAMLRHKLTSALVLVVASAQGAETAAQQRCIAQLQAEQARIDRDFTRDRPPAGDKAAHDRWAKNLHAALTAAGREAESCERQSRPSLTPDRRTALDACIARVGAKGDEIQRRYSGRSLSREEQAKQRAEQQELLEQRGACVQASQK